MAGDWLKVEKDTPEKPEIFAIAETLGMDPEKVFAKCFKLWAWADSHTTDGNAQGVTPSRVDELLHAPGFAVALAEVGWLSIRSGALQIPNFGRHMGQSGKTRALTAKRVAAHKARQGNDKVTPDALPEKRREEKSKGGKPPLDPPAPAAGMPPVLDTPEFRAAWAEWVQYRKERRQSLTPTGIRQQLKRLAGFGHDGAIASIQHSIANGYQGLIDPAEFQHSRRNGQKADLFGGIEEFVKGGPFRDP